MKNKITGKRTLRHATTNNRAEKESSHLLLAWHDRQAVLANGAAVTATAALPGVAGSFECVPVGSLSN